MSGKHSRKRTRSSRYALVAVVVAAVIAAVAVGTLYLMDRGEASPRLAAGSTVSSSPGGSSRTSSSQAQTDPTTLPMGSAQGPSPTDTAQSGTSTVGTAGSSTTSIIGAASTTSTTARPSLTVAAGGDVLGDRGVGAFIDKKGGPAVFAGVKPYLEDADLAFVNLECPVSTKGKAVTTKEYTFRGRLGLIDGLVSAGIDVVSMANNHALDYGPAALLDTITRLDKAGIGHAGAGANDTAALAPAMLDTPAGTVAVLAFTDIIPGGFPAGPNRAGVNPASPDRAKVLAAIKAAKAKADYVIVSFHWGIEYTGNADQDQRKLAHQAIDAGADLVLGHHPHVIQGLELYHGKLIAYSMGDFVFDHYSRTTGEAFVLRVSLPPQGPPDFEIVPVYLNETTGVPAAVTGAAADSILTRLTKLSSALGLQLTRAGDRAVFSGQR